MFFQELGPDNIFLYKTSGDPSLEPPKERKRPPLKPEYADAIRRWCTIGRRTSACSSIIPPVVDGQPITARVPGFESENINVAGQSPNMSEISPRDFAVRPLLHPGRRSARRARGGDRRRMSPIRFSPPATRSTAP